LEDGILKPYLNFDGFEARSQDLPPVYFINGSVYLLSPTQLRKAGSLICKGAIPVICNTVKESIDIDTAEDFEYAEFLLSST
jgi:CMP-N,N'-diacetyllegionaminic acid synthase